jgi:hypothetical protein
MLTLRETCKNIPKAFSCNFKIRLHLLLMPVPFASSLIYLHYSARASVGGYGKATSAGERIGMSIEVGCVLNAESERKWLRAIENSLARSLDESNFSRVYSLQRRQLFEGLFGSLVVIQSVSIVVVVITAHLYDRCEMRIELN